MNRRTATWVAVIAAVLVAGAVASYFQSGRVDSEDATPREITEAVATLVAVGDCPWGEASCILAQGIERALQRGNVKAVMDFGAPRFYICPGGNAGPMPLCAGLGPDVGREGYPVRTRHQEQTVIGEEATRQRLESFVGAIRPEARDEVGLGRLELYGFACDRLAVRVQPVSCAHVGIILSAIVSRDTGPRREVLVFWAVGGFAGRALPFTEVWDGPVAASEIGVLFRTGGELADLGDVHVIEHTARD